MNIAPLVASKNCRCWRYFPPTRRNIG